MGMLLLGMYHSLVANHEARGGLNVAISRDDVAAQVVRRAVDPSF